MTTHELEARDIHEVGRGGLKLPELEINDGDFYPHDAVRFLGELWEMNEAGEVEIGQPSKARNTGYFVVPANEDKPAIFAFGEITKGPSRYDSPVTTYQFFTPPTETGGLQLIMSFEHSSSYNSGFAGSRDSLVLLDHDGQTTVISLYGHRRNGKYQPDEFANYKTEGEYTYDSPEDQASLQTLAQKMRELMELLK